ncbi:hypothetical protein CC86DRAFT_383084 [Ophiobolus disseminans]|uniref:Fungal calcium binding protein domain-containing protein n=1 Tax=Ophiobolus disseminans TaxID=1469910 RepID=A0A6A6ZVR4_9PLEO|nr:hypothetical protein CC86DRAFT_383084 [Ophiobolus disseminans]
MQFTNIIISLFAALAIAAPEPIAIREEATEISLVAEAIEFSMAPAADCSHRKCFKVLAAAGCIGLSIAARNPRTLVKCGNLGAGAICGCAGCVPRLNNFLVEHHVCH